MKTETSNYFKLVYVPPQAKAIQLAVDNIMDNTFLVISNAKLGELPDEEEITE